MKIFNIMILGGLILTTVTLEAMGASEQNPLTEQSQSIRRSPPPPYEEAIMNPSFPSSCLQNRDLAPPSDLEIQEKSSPWPCLIAGCASIGVGLLNSRFFEVFYISSRYEVRMSTLSTAILKGYLFHAEPRTELMNLGFITAGMGMIYHSVTRYQK